MEQSLVINENERKNLVCPICKNLFTIPKVIKCRHVFCEKCLIDYFEHNNYRNLQCPVCKERIVVPKNGLQGFRTEILYEEIIEKIKKNDELIKHMKTGVCGLCRKNSELISKCLTCACVICRQCFPIHNTLKPHCTVVDLSDIDNLDEEKLIYQRKVVCEFHDTQLADLYCHDCNKMICLICKVTEPKHSNHTCEHIHKRSAFCRAYLKELQDKTAKLTEEAISASPNIDAIFSDLLSDLQDVENKVNTTIDLIIADLNTKRKDFLKSIDEKKKEFKTRLGRQKDKIENVKSKGQTLRDDITKASTNRTDAEIAILPNDLDQEFEKIEEDLESSLHKDFRIKVDFHEGEYDDLKRIINEFNIGRIEYSQKVAVKTLKERPHDIFQKIYRGISRWFSYGGYDRSGIDKIVVFTDGSDKNTEIRLVNEKTKKDEKFILPSSLNAKGLQRQNIIEKRKGLLYIKMENNDKIPAIIYLP